MARRVVGLGLLLALTCAGCARADWIESTLVTVDVAGQWDGIVQRSPLSTTIELRLKQSGARVSGTS